LSDERRFVKDERYSDLTASVANFVRVSWQR